MREGDFERLYAEHAQPLFGFLAYRTGDRALAEDLLADTFEAAYRARRRFDRRKASERTWLYAIAL
ncbi:MAG: RNA polymerase, partial [Solirubrobacterales bacterium]|nr:RNA polymerase [Solirubrobacterales bacterium]